MVSYSHCPNSHREWFLQKSGTSRSAPSPFTAAYAILMYTFVGEVHLKRWEFTLSLYNFTIMFIGCPSKDFSCSLPISFLCCSIGAHGNKMGISIDRVSRKVWNGWWVNGLTLILLRSDSHQHLLGVCTEATLVLYQKWEGGEKLVVTTLFRSGCCRFSLRRAKSLSHNIFLRASTAQGCLKPIGDEIVGNGLVSFLAEKDNQQECFYYYYDYRQSHLDIEITRKDDWISRDGVAKLWVALL